MDRNFYSLFLALFALVLIGPLGCGDASRRKTSGRLPFEIDGFNSEHSNILKRDAEVLGSLPVAAVETETFDTSSSSGRELQAWLQNRVKHVVGPDFSMENKIFEGDANTRTFYQTSSVGDRTSQFLRTSPAMAMNLGALLFLESKEAADGRRFAVRFKGRDLIAVTPRIGVLALTDIYFMEHPMPTDISPSEFAKSIARLSLLFHEGRHSDGNGENAGFPHHACVLSGRRVPICDGASNGSNAVAAAFIDYAINTCAKCNAMDKEYLRAISTNYRSRIVYGAQYRDPNPESL